MIKQRINAALLFFLLTAFLAVTWTPAHAHLPTQHDHSGERHQHSVAAHSHQPQVFHADPIDIGHLQLDETRVVNLDLDQTPPSSNKLDNPAAGPGADVSCPAIVRAGSTALPGGQDWLPRPLHRHPGQPRAPPRLF